MNAGVQVLCECPNCRVEAALVELVSPEGRMGGCRLCGYATANGEVIEGGRRFADAADVFEALRGWAAIEGEPSVEQFVQVNFTSGDVGTVCRAILAGERVETGFDVIAWLFRDKTSGQVAMGGEPVVDRYEPGASQGASAALPSPVGEDVRIEFTPSAPVSRPNAGAPSSPPEPSPSEAQKRAITRALCAVALADGIVEPAERAVLERVIGEFGSPQPEASDWRLWRPADLPRPPDPAAAIAAMRKVALANSLPDPSEERMIREFARAWAVRVGDEVLPPVTFVQKFVRSWEGWFGR